MAAKRSAGADVPRDDLTGANGQRNVVLVSGRTKTWYAAGPRGCRVGCLMKRSLPPHGRRRERRCDGPRRNSAAVLILYGACGYQEGKRDAAPAAGSCRVSQRRDGAGVRYAAPESGAAHRTVANAADPHQFAAPVTHGRRLRFRVARQRGLGPSPDIPEASSDSPPWNWPKPVKSSPNSKIICTPALRGQTVWVSWSRDH
jgi:hypothetical protein